MPSGAVEDRYLTYMPFFVTKNPIDVGRTVPDTALSDQDGVVRRLSDYRGQKVVLFFYPKDDTPG